MNKKITFIMPTYNSELTIGESLDSIKKQNYPQKLVEVLVIDGGSSDKTLAIAGKYKAKILKNPRKQQEYAKTIGLHNANGDIVTFLDSDEVFAKKNTIREIVNAFEKYKLLIILTSGYRKPKNASSINDYINHFSDPFAHFMYGTSSEEKTKIQSWKRKYRNFISHEGIVIFNFEKSKDLPLVDMAAGTSIDLKKVKDSISTKEFNEERFITRLYYIISKKDYKVGIVEDQPIIHYSADSYKKFLSKLRWRSRVNIHYKSIPGTGYSNREDFQSPSFRFRKYLFPVYSFTLVLPLLDSAISFFKYRKPALLLHLPLTLYTTAVIIYEYFLLILNIKPKLSTYGKNKSV